MTKEERESRIQQILNANGDIPIITESLMAIRDEFDDYESRWAEIDAERKKIYRGGRTATGRKS